MFNDELVNIIKNGFPGCMKEGINSYPEYYPDIPKKHERKSYGHILKTDDDDEVVLMLFDSSLFNNGKNGLILTDKGIYFKDLFSSLKICEYKDWIVGTSNLAEMFDISDEEPLLLADKLTELMNEIYNYKLSSGQFQEEAIKLRESFSQEDGEEKVSAKQEALELGLGLADIITDVMSDPRYE